VFGGEYEYWRSDLQQLGHDVEGQRPTGDVRQRLGANASQHLPPGSIEGLSQRAGSVRFAGTWQPSSGSVI
jgi:hypothetical protein